jgi:hypothetical protein
MTTPTRPHHQERVKRLALVLPTDIADEICDQPTAAKAMLLLEVADELLEKLDGFPSLMLSATTTQWVKSLGKREQCQLIENLALMLMCELNPESKQ